MDLSSAYPSAPGAESLPTWGTSGDEHAAAAAPPADGLQVGPHHAAIDPNLELVMEDQLRQLRHQLAAEGDDGAPAPDGEGSKAPSVEAHDDGADGQPSTAQPPTGPPLAFHNLVHPPPASSSSSTAAAAEEHSPSDAHPTEAATPAPSYTPGPFNPYPDPTAAAPPPHQEQPVASGSKLPESAAPSTAPYKRKEPTTDDEERRRKQSKRAEQNRQAQRAFRERREQHIAELEHKARQLQAVRINEAETMRKLQLASNVIAQLRVENDNLKATVSKLTAQLNGEHDEAAPEEPQEELQPAAEHDEHEHVAEDPLPMHEEPPVDPFVAPAP